MVTLQKKDMEIQELYDILVGTLFPKDITDHFTIVHVEPLPDVLVVHFEEKEVMMHEIVGNY